MQIEVMSLFLDNGAVVLEIDKVICVLSFGGLWIGYLNVAGEGLFLDERRGEFSLMQSMERLG